MTADVQTGRPAARVQVRERVCAHLLAVSRRDRAPEDDEKLVVAFNLESVQVLELVSRVEREFGIIIGEEDLTPIETVGDLVEAVEAALGTSRPGEATP